MVADPQNMRLIHEDDLVVEGVFAGHSSLVERLEFRRRWNTHWDVADADADFRHTVLYAGELCYEEGIGVTSWNNRSGHYQPGSAAHIRVGLDEATFEPVDSD